MDRRLNEGREKSLDADRMRPTTVLEVFVGGLGSTKEGLI